MNEPSPTLAQLETWSNQAARKLAMAILRQWPEGTAIRCRLNRNQLNPTDATVLSASGDGRLTVKLKTIGRRGYNTIKHVHWTNVIP